MDRDTHYLAIIDDLAKIQEHLGTINNAGRKLAHYADQPDSNLEEAAKKVHCLEISLRGPLILISKIFAELGM